jgi:hypothetical protein
MKGDVLAVMGDYKIVKEDTCAFGESNVECIKLYKNSTQIGWHYYHAWLKNPSIEYWMKEYIEDAYKLYKAKYEQIEDLMNEGKVIEDDILDVSDTLDYYRGFGKEEGS